MKKRNLRTYDKDFKLNAVKLYIENERSFQQIAEEIGIPSTTLVGWVNNHKKEGSEAFPGKGHVKPSDEELMQLRKELAIVREERDILKKALGIFSAVRK